MSEKPTDIIARERAHFDGMAGGDALFWADRTPAGTRRKEIRAAWFVDAARLEAGKTVLELGCGLGHMTRALAQVTPAHIVATDLSPRLIETARRQDTPGVEFQVANAEALDFPTAMFDAVVGNAVLHHLRLDRTLPELLRVLRPGGRLCFVEPNYLNPQVFVVLSVPPLRRWAGGSPDETAYVRWRLRRTLRQLPLVDVRVDPFDFLYPAIPPRWIAPAERLSRVLERTPLVREIAGSLAISATRAS